MNRYYIPASELENATLLARIQDVARQGRTHYARHLLKTGLYAGQERIMEALAGADSLTPGELSHMLGVRAPTVTKTIGRLEEQGFVARDPSKTDGRQIHVRLTENGRAVLGAMAKAVGKAEKQALKGLKKKERKQLEKALAKIEENLAANADDASGRAH